MANLKKKLTAAALSLMALMLSPLSACKAAADADTWTERLSEMSLDLMMLKRRREEQPEAPAAA